MFMTLKHFPKDSSYIKFQVPIPRLLNGGWYDVPEHGTRFWFCFYSSIAWLSSLKMPTCFLSLKKTSTIPAREFN